MDLATVVTRNCLLIGRDDGEKVRLRERKEERHIEMDREKER